ncbi:uncharacterized protein EI90DRAFT_3089590 [Cantharellus anzutake]|uniref:uncharacterized protein n=1 Tax=Cantharellus anzutake TaxID=1750568 RepID=UPI001908B6CD|nr:uncharacterized protein EI90DRAFT_3089590 [Cantharellus anzutake]KAF8314602.1 hypothetical protein EI90DRAFT_3089590 [Cantharellus anzutake]
MTPESVDNFKSIVSLVIFLFANVLVVIPFTIRCTLPAVIVRPLETFLTKSRIIPGKPSAANEHRTASASLEFAIPIDHSTAPLLAVLVLLSTGSITGREVRDGVLGSDGVKPIDVMALFISLAYISISLDSTGLLRFLAFWVLKNGGSKGRLLYFLLYIFFFTSGVVVGNDPVILSGTAFLAYMTRTAGIDDPTAWIYSQFAIVNIASAVLVSSNPTNLVLSGAFGISFIIYTANVIVPVFLTAALLFPCLLAFFIKFPDYSSMRKDRDSRTPASLLPKSIHIDTFISSTSISGVSGATNNNDPSRMLLIDPGGAFFGLLTLGVTLVALLATSAAHVGVGVYAITVPAAVLMFVRDVLHDWRSSRPAQAKAAIGDEAHSVDGHRPGNHESVEMDALDRPRAPTVAIGTILSGNPQKFHPSFASTSSLPHTVPAEQTLTGLDEAAVLTSSEPIDEPPSSVALDNNNNELDRGLISYPPATTALDTSNKNKNRPRLFPRSTSHPTVPSTLEVEAAQKPHYTLITFFRSATSKISRDFPTPVTTITRLPLSLLPFAFSMFILVQGLASNGWVGVLVKWWETWVRKTGTVGAVGGMGFIGVIACNVAGTNIGATILLARVLQQWDSTYTPSLRTRDAAIYALALSSNYGAFSLSFSASLAGLLWRSILAQKHIHLKQKDFARINAPIVACAMIIGCSVLLAQVYIMKQED